MVKYTLCGSEQAIRLAGNVEISAADSGSFIDEASTDIYTKYSPVYRSKIWVDTSAIDAGSLMHKFTPDFIDFPVQIVGSVTIAGSYFPFAAGSYTVDGSDGTITFAGSGMFANRNGDQIGIEYIPKMFNSYAACLSALYIVDNELLLTPSDALSARADRLKMRVGSYEMTLRPKGAFGSNSGMNNIAKRVYQIDNPFNEIRKY